MCVRHAAHAVRCYSRLLYILIHRPLFRIKITCYNELISLHGPTKTRYTKWGLSLLALVEAFVTRIKTVELQKLCLILIAFIISHKMIATLLLSDVITWLYFDPGHKCCFYQQHVSDYPLHHNVEKHKAVGGSVISSTRPNFLKYSHTYEYSTTLTQSSQPQANPPIW